MKCTPWTATSKSIKAGETEVHDTFTAFKLSLSYYFEDDAVIEFKYRKDTLKDNMINGEFKFIVNNKRIFSNSDYQENDWQTYTHEI